MRVPQFTFYAIDSTNLSANKIAMMVAKRLYIYGVNREVKSNSPMPEAMETGVGRNKMCNKSWWVTTLAKKSIYLNAQESGLPRAVDDPGHSCADRFFESEQYHSGP